MGRRPKPKGDLDVKLEDLPPDLRWREWMGRVEAVIFAAAEPVTRETLARVVGRDCPIEALIEDICAELTGRPYELAAVAGGFVLRTKKTFGAAIRAATGQGTEIRSLSQLESLVLFAIALFQPVTRAELGTFFGKEISRDLIAALRGHAFIGPGPRSPLPGAPYTYVTTKTFLAHFGFDTLLDPPNFAALEEAGLLCKETVLAGEFGAAFTQGEDKFEGEAAFDESA
jgi:chromosome segregation and condensation protein ScpB